MYKRQILSHLYQEEIVDKKEFLTKHHIALFDVCASCEIKGSSDASIKKVGPNDPVSYTHLIQIMEENISFMISILPIKMNIPV